jgi:hypothetical protein
MAGCEEDQNSGGATAAPTLETTNKGAPLAFDGEQGEYYVIAYMHCHNELKVLAEEYGTEPVAEPVANAHAVRYGDVFSRGAYRGCLDAIEGSPNKLWRSVKWLTTEDLNGSAYRPR